MRAKKFKSVAKIVKKTYFCKKYVYYGNWDKNHSLSFI